MGFLTTCGRVLLVVVNIIFLVIGLVLFVAGFFCRFGDSVLKTYYQPALDSLSSSLSSSGFGDVDLSSFNISDLIGTLGIAFIVSGLFLMIITILGFCGSCCKIKILIIGYIIAMGVVVTGEVILIGLLYGSDSTIKDPLKQTLKDNIKTDYQGLNGTNVVSLAWNFIHIEIKCCGVDNYQDFTGATQWVTGYTSHTLATPLSCCKTLPDSSDFSCASSPTDASNYWKTSCFDTLWDKALGNSLLIGLVVGGCAVFQILLVIFAICLCRDEKKNKVGDSGKKKRR